MCIGVAELSLTPILPFLILGKHGHAKVHLVGIDIFNGKKYEDICPSTHNMDVPHVKREDYQLTDIDDGFLVLMSDGGDLREDLKIPEGDLGVQLRADYDAGKELLVSTLTNQSAFVLANNPFLFSALS